MLNISSINIHIYAIEFVLNKRLENKLPNVRDARYLRRLCWSNILTYSKERENTGSFRSRYKRNPLRFFTRQRLLSRLLPLRNNPLRRHYRAPARPFQPLPLQQSYPSFSYTPPLLVINAHDKVGAHSYSRSLRTLSRTLSLFSSYSSSHFFWSLFFSTDHFVSLSCCCTDSCGAKMLEIQWDTRNATPWPDWTMVTTSVHPVSVDRDVNRNATRRISYRTITERGQLSINSRSHRELEILKRLAFLWEPFIFFLFFRQAHD